VLTTALSMDMPVLNLFSCCITNVDNLNSEIEHLASQRVIRIHGYCCIIDSDDLNQLNAIVGFRLKTHAHLNITIKLERLFGHALNQLIGLMTIGIFRLNGYGNIVTNALAFQFTLKARNQSADTMNVGQRITITG